LLDALVIFIFLRALCVSAVSLSEVLCGFSLRLRAFAVRFFMFAFTGRTKTI
jgi:hypothetical protein